MARRQRVSPKQKRYADLVPHCKSRKEAALLAGYSKSVAHKVAEKIEDREGFKRYVRTIFPKDRFADILDRGLKASRPVFNSEGELVGETDDWKEIYKFWKDGGSVCGYFRKEDEEDDNQKAPMQLTVILNGGNARVANPGSL